MRADTLKGRAVVMLANAATIGRFDDVLSDADYRTVLGFLVKAGAFHRAEGLSRPGARAIGADAMTVDDHSAVDSQDRFSELAAAQRPSAADRRRGGVACGRHHDRSGRSRRTAAPGSDMMVAR